MHVSENDRLRELAAAITTEQDPDKFSALVEELNRLLDPDEWPLRARVSPPDLAD